MRCSRRRLRLRTHVRSLVRLQAHKGITEQPQTRDGRRTVKQMFYDDDDDGDGCGGGGVGRTDAAYCMVTVRHIEDPAATSLRNAREPGRHGVRPHTAGREKKSKT